MNPDRGHRHEVRLHDQRRLLLLESMPSAWTWSRDSKSSPTRRAGHRRSCSSPSCGSLGRGGGSSACPWCSLAGSPREIVSMAARADMSRLGALQKRPMAPDPRDLHYQLLRPFEKALGDSFPEGRDRPSSGDGAWRRSATQLAVGQPRCELCWQRERSRSGHDATMTSSCRRDTSSAKALNRAVIYDHLW